MKKGAVTVTSVIISIVILVSGIILLAQVMLKSSSTYTMAIEELTNNPIANEIVGHSIKQKGFVLGSTKTTGASGEANIRFDISASNGKFTIFAEGVSEYGEWKLTALYAHNEEQGLKNIVPGPSPFEGIWSGVDNDDDDMELIFSDSNWEISWPGTAYPTRAGTFTWSGNTVTLMSGDQTVGQIIISDNSLTGNLLDVAFTLTKR